MLGREWLKREEPVEGKRKKIWRSEGEWGESREHEEGVKVCRKGNKD